MQLTLPSSPLPGACIPSPQILSIQKSLLLLPLGDEQSALPMSAFPKWYIITVNSIKLMESILLKDEKKGRFHCPLLYTYKKLRSKRGLLDLPKVIQQTGTEGFSGLYWPQLRCQRALFHFWADCHYSKKPVHAAWSWRTEQTALSLRSWFYHR